MRRREFTVMLIGMAGWPLTASAQQSSLPVIGLLLGVSQDAYTTRLAAFRQGLKKEGFVESENVAIEFRSAGGDYDRLPMLAAELVQRRVAVIAALGGTPSAVAAQAATATIPIVFEVAVDPVEAGFVASLSRPGGNLTGVTNLNVEIGPKQLKLLRELVPTLKRVGVLVNPTNTGTITEPFTHALGAAASALGIEFHVLPASTQDDFETAFHTLSEQKAASGLVIMPDLFFYAHNAELGALSLRHAMPTIYRYRAFVAAGGLASYSSSETEAFELTGVSVGKILNGAKPSDIPVQQATRAELIINLKTANALGLTVSPSLLARADEVIE